MTDLPAALRSLSLAQTEGELNLIDASYFPRGVSACSSRPRTSPPTRPNTSVCPATAPSSRARTSRCRGGAVTQHLPAGMRPRGLSLVDVREDHGQGRPRSGQEVRYRRAARGQESTRYAGREAATTRWRCRYSRQGRPALRQQPRLMHFVDPRNSVNHNRGNDMARHAAKIRSNSRSSVTPPRTVPFSTTATSGLWLYRLSPSPT
jgi:hypothetical protein